MDLKKILVGTALAASALAANAAATVNLQNVPGDSNAWTFFGAVTDPDTTFKFDPATTASGLYDTLLTFGFGGFGFGATSQSVTLDGNALTFDSNTGTYSFQGILSDSEHSIQLLTSGYVFGLASTTVTVSAVPVPEPETYAMLLAGLGAIGFMSRRRKARQA